MTLSLSELTVIEKLYKKIQYHAPTNLERERYFTGRNRLKDMKISIPPQLTSVEAVVGWPGTAVQVLEERLDLEGFIGPDTLGIEDIFRANDLDSESSLAHTDALIFGVGFAIVGKGLEGEADPLITVESPKRMTALYDLRLRRVTAALAISLEDENEIYSTVYGSLYLPDRTISVVMNDGRWTELDRDEHNLGRTPVVRLVNQPRSSDTDGRSEITRAVRYYTDGAMRTLLGAEVAREFYSAPQRYALGANEDTFQDSDGNPLNPWSVIQGRMLALPYNEESGVMPQVGQFQANSTQPYFEQIKALAQMLAAETAIPPSYLGFQTDNPASADAIRQMEARLVKRAERRQRQFGRAWSEVARLSLLVRDGEIPAEAAEIRPVWRDASTPTRAAAADEAVKLISAGVFLPDSEITYNRIGLSDSDKQVLQQEKTAVRATDLLTNLLQAPAQQQTEEVIEVETGEIESEDRGTVVDEFQGIVTGQTVTLSDGRQGRVEHIMTGGVLGVPGSPFAIQATPTDPGMTIRIIENGQETEMLINVRYSELRG
jgi:hypothetical protein